MSSRDQILSLMRERVHHPASMRELLQTLKIPRDERTSFKRHVKGLVAGGDLVQIRGHRFGLPEKMDLYVGRLQAHPAGYGFVTPERPLEPAGGDIYIAGPHLNEAMQGDRVVVRIERIKDGGRAEGRVIRILERANEWIVGRYDRDDSGMGYVVPFDRRVLMDIFIPAGQEGGASPGDMVTVSSRAGRRLPEARSVVWARYWATSMRPASIPKSSFENTAFPTRIHRTR